jgi:hypothetical protein
MSKFIEVTNAQATGIDAINKHSSQGWRSRNTGNSQHGQQAITAFMKIIQ